MKGSVLRELTFAEEVGMVGLQSGVELALSLKEMQQELTSLGLMAGREA